MTLANRFPNGSGTAGIAFVAFILRAWKKVKMMFSNYPDILTVKQVGEMLRIGRNNAYELLRSGQLKSVKIGKAYRVPKKWVLEYLKNYRKTT